MCVAVLFTGLVRQKRNQYGIYAACCEGGTVRRCGRRRFDRADDLDFVNDNVANDLLSKSRREIDESRSWLVRESEVTCFRISKVQG